jgi:hypothetical protein
VTIHSFRGFLKAIRYSRFKVIDTDVNPDTFDASTHLNSYDYAICREPNYPHIPDDSNGDCCYDVRRYH